MRPHMMVTRVRTCRGLHERPRIIRPVLLCVHGAGYLRARPGMLLLLMQGDISAGKMIFGVDGVDPERRARLIELLDIDLQQRMTTMSDGQRRRVQICMGLLKPYEVRAGIRSREQRCLALHAAAARHGTQPRTAHQHALCSAVGQRPRRVGYRGMHRRADCLRLSSLTHTCARRARPALQVLLLDEITVDLDVVGRLRLLEFFKQECEVRGATIVYATHIFDGLEGWVTHVAYMEEGQIIKGGPKDSIAEFAALQQPAPGTAAKRKVLHVVEDWLRAEKVAREAREEAAGVSVQMDAPIKPQRTPIMPSKHLAFFR